jgi:hypothetical protein
VVVAVDFLRKNSEDILKVPLSVSKILDPSKSTPVAHGRNPLLYETLRVGGSLSLWEKTALAPR